MTYLTLLLVSSEWTNKTDCESREKGGANPVWPGTQYDGSVTPQIGEYHNTQPRYVSRVSYTSGGTA